MKKELARIEDVILSIEDHGILTCSVSLDKENGMFQSFGGYCLDGYDEKLKRRIGTAGGMDWILRLLQIFHVSKLEDIKGKMVYALYDDMSTTVKGLQTLKIDGDEIFLIEDWRKQWFPKTTKEEFG